jgi:hypothetical protein
MTGEIAGYITGRMLVRLMIQEAERLEEKSALSLGDALSVVEIMYRNAHYVVAENVTGELASSPHKEQLIAGRTSSMEH